MPAMRDFFQRRGKFRPEQADEERRSADPGGPVDQMPHLRRADLLAELERSAQVCPKCSYHLRLRARERIAQLSDPGSFVELHADLRPEDPLGFDDGAGSYDQKLEQTRASPASRRPSSSARPRSTACRQRLP